MPLDLRAAAVYNFTLRPREPFPLVRGWNRLEGRPRSEDFGRSLRAEVRDPLWFLTRQWQYGEFEAEDGGSPIDARIAYQIETIDRYSTGDQVQPYDTATPLEVRVEREAVPFDLMFHMQAGRVFERLLTHRSLGTRLTDHVNLFVLDYDSHVEGRHTSEARHHFDAGRRHLFDAAQLIASVRDGSYPTRISGLVGLSATEAQSLLECGQALVAWFDRTHAQPAEEAEAWRQERLDYQFAVVTQADTRLHANEYRGGDLDWDAFSSAAAPGEAPAQPTTNTLSFLPSPIRFSAMPASRYWQMEDGQIDIGRLDVNVNDLARLLLTEFILLFSDAWGVVPLELPIGTLTRIDGILTTDVFGNHTFIKAGDTGGSDWQRWNMFSLSGDGVPAMGLLLAPSLTARHTSSPLEEVHFLRDEMANMVWAVEHRVASKLGEPFNPEVGQTLPPPSPAEGAPRYRLGELVPENWRPFIPAHVPGSTRAIRLQRARLPGQSAEPLGRIIAGAAPLFIAEEEVPRAGRIVRRSFQRARWTNGRAFLWIGRESLIGRGEGSSGLAFDNVND
jgi:hypothetical protein